MAEEEVNTQQAEGNSEPNPSTQADKNEIPLHEHPRFKEVISQKNEALKQVSEYQAHEKAKAEETLKEKGEFNTILADRDSIIEKLNKQIEGMSGEITSFRDGLVNQVAEKRRYITKGMAIEDLQQFVQEEQVVANAGKTDSSRAGVTAKGDFGGYSSYAEWASKDPKGYEEANGIVGGNRLNLSGNNV